MSDFYDKFQTPAFIDPTGMSAQAPTIDPATGVQGPSAQDIYNQQQASSVADNRANVGGAAMGTGYMPGSDGADASLAAQRPTGPLMDTSLMGPSTSTGKNTGSAGLSAAQLAAGGSATPAQGQTWNLGIAGAGAGNQVGSAAAGANAGGVTLNPETQAQLASTGDPAQVAAQAASAPVAIPSVAEPAAIPAGAPGSTATGAAGGDVAAASLTAPGGATASAPVAAGGGAPAAGPFGTGAGDPLDFLVSATGANDYDAARALRAGGQSLANQGATNTQAAFDNSGAMGGEALSRGDTAAANVNATAGTAAGTAGELGTQAASDAQVARMGTARADTGTAQSMGANAADTERIAQESSAASAERAGMTAATQGSRAALRAARTGGLNAGQASMVAAQGAGDQYTAAAEAERAAAMGRYGGNVGAFQGQAGQMAGRTQAAQGVQEGAVNLGLGAGNLQGTAGNLALTGTGQGLTATGQQAGIAENQLQGGLGAYQQGTAASIAGHAPTGALAEGISGAANGIATAISDRNAKTNIKADSSLDSIMAKMKGGGLDAILSKLKPSSFSYKDPANGEGKQIGVMAQDLEKTPLAGAVKETPQGKAVDTGQVSMATLALLGELYQRVRALEGAKS